jgi:hypothetical protein
MHGLHEEYVTVEFQDLGGPPKRNSLQSTFEAVPACHFLASWQEFDQSQDLFSPQADPGEQSPSGPFDVMLDVRSPVVTSGQWSGPEPRDALGRRRRRYHVVFTEASQSYRGVFAAVN